MDAAALFGAACQARQIQDIESAVEAIDEAHRLSPDNPQIAAVRALLHYESWRPSAGLFARACTLNPGDMELIRNRALALASEGERDAAEAWLESALAQHPKWTEGHGILARIRLTTGDAVDYDRSYAQACAHQDGSLALHLAWFHQAAMIRDWEKVGEILAKAETLYPGQNALRSARFYLSAESGDDAAADTAFADVERMRDPGLDLCRVRYHLRRGQWGAAEECARRHIGTPAGAMFWPYLSLIWRVTGNALAQWLDGAPPHLAVLDLDISLAQISDLAEMLRRLHILQAPYPEQSVRGGTQTDRPLFFHPDPRVQSIRRMIMDAVRGYVQALPPQDPRHPLLAADRSKLLLDGSWSVRLVDRGFHASHSHVNGWISSAFYVALPDQPGPPPSGHFALGTPPPELGLDMPAYQTVEPRPGRLVLFPSTMWHSTIPFDAGERLTIAFDIKRT